MRYCRYIFAIAISTLLLFMTGSVAFAQAGLIEKWEPTQYVEKMLNANTFCIMQTEYPTFKTGTKSLFLLITNRGSKGLLFGPAYTLEKKMPDGWLTQTISSTDPDTVLVWKSDAYGVASKTMRGSSIGFSLPLAPGEYRIIKSIGIDGKPDSDTLFCAYFEVADSGYDAEYLSGYAPLASLSEKYTMAQAIQDGAFYMDDEYKVYNPDPLLTFLTKISQGISTKLRVAYDGKEGGYALTDFINLPEQSYFWAETRIMGATADSERRDRQAPSISRSYYNYLNTLKKGDKTMLVMTDWIGKAIEKASFSPIAYDVNGVGKSKITSLLRKIYGKNPASAYQVYGKDPNTFVSYTNDKGIHKIQYTLTGRSLEEAVIADSKGMIRDLLGIEWTNNQKILLIFSTEEQGAECWITFDPVLNRIVSEEYK